MDSTLISASPQEDSSLHHRDRARRAALGSFAGAVVDWYDFLLYGITAASFSRKSARRWARSRPLPPLVSDFYSAH